MRGGNKAGYPDGFTTLFATLRKYPANRQVQRSLSLSLLSSNADKFRNKKTSFYLPQAINELTS